MEHKKLAALTIKGAGLLFWSSLGLLLLSPWSSPGTSLFAGLKLSRIIRDYLSDLIADGTDIIVIIFILSAVVSSITIYILRNQVSNKSLLSSMQLILMIIMIPCVIAILYAFPSFQGVSVAFLPKTVCFSVGAICNMTLGLKGGLELAVSYSGYAQLIVTSFVITVLCCTLSCYLEEYVRNKVGFVVKTVFPRM